MCDPFTVKLANEEKYINAHFLQLSAKKSHHRHFDGICFKGKNPSIILILYWTIFIAHEGQKRELETLQRLSEIGQNMISPNHIPSTTSTGEDYTRNDLQITLTTLLALVWLM